VSVTVYGGAEHNYRMVLEAEWAAIEIASLRSQ
jgi:hypothetical protein